MGFFGVDYASHSRGLITSISENCSLIIFFSISLGLFIEIYFKEMDKTFSLLNLYGPYKGKEDFWERLFAINCIRTNSFIIGGYLNFKINMDEIWGPLAREDKLDIFFLDKMELAGLVNVADLVQ